MSFDNEILAHLGVCVGTVARFVVRECCDSLYGMSARWLGTKYDVLVVCYGVRVGISSLSDSE
jgi:hypothetical protein